MICACLVAVGAAGDAAAAPPRPDLETINAGLDPNDARIRDLVAYLGRGGILLSPFERGYWRLSEARGRDFIPS